jgi:hypothetical protein
MLDSLRKPFLIVAIVLMALAVLAELGAGFLLTPRPPAAADLGSLNDQAKVPEDEAISLDEIRRLRSENEAPPGLAIRYMALLDGLVLFTVGLMGLGLLIPERVHGRLQGLATLIVSFLVLLGGFFMLLAAFVLLLVMVSMFLAAPFGTLAYLAIYGFFDRGGASVTLSLLMLLKLGFAVCLVLAHQRFLQIKRIIALVLTTLLANVVVSFLHGLVPGFLVSITDALAALVVDILALIWALVMLIFSLVSIIKVLRLRRAES